MPDESNASTDAPKNASNGLTFIKGVGLVIGGATLGFFGCLGGLGADSITLVVVALVAGGAVIIWGAALMIIGFVKGLSGLAKPKD